jgi:hypothetical protein
VRALLIAGCVAAIVIAAHGADPSAQFHADPALALLLRGMALIKATMVIAVVGAVMWRCGWSLSQRALYAYLVGSWILAGSTTLIWQLTSIPLAALLFHAAAIGMLLVSWRDQCPGGIFAGP